MNDGTTARFVVGNPASLTPDDQLLFDELDSEGYDIVLVDDDAAASAPSGTALIVIGPSTSGASLGGKYELTAALILIFASSAWDSMGLTETDGAVADTSTLAWVDASHPIADLLPSPVKVTPSVEPMRSMAAVNLADGAVPVATRANNANANVVFTIDTGGTLADGTAARAPRVVIGFTQTAIQQLNADGWVLVENAMYWADELAFRSGAQPSVTPPAAPPLKHQWKLDAVPSMTDTPANGASAASGQTTGVSVGSDSTGTYYVFSPSLSPIGEVVDHVASNPPEPIDDLDPGSSDFAVTIRVNLVGTAVKSYNVVQKGKNDAAIPNWKIEVGGEKSQWVRTVTCVFGSTTTSRVRLRSTAKVKQDVVPGATTWSTITCQRSGSDYWVTVTDFDGSTPGQAKSKVKHDTKSRTISNDEPLHLGTKQAGDSDTFDGFLDDLRFSR